MTTPPPRLGSTIACVALGFLGNGCAQSTRSTAPKTPEVAAANPGGAIAATVDGQPITASSLSVPALEAAGAVALEEAMLDRLVSKELLAAGLSVGASEIEQERILLFERISQEAQVAEEQAGALIERFRKSRGLGPVRFAGLLRRNAQLRALIRSQSPPTAEQISELTQADLGPKAVARILVVANTTDAAALLAQLQSCPESQRSSLFARLAVERSRDPSSGRGGMFGPVSHMDQSVPASLRGFLAAPAGSLSPVVAIDSGMAIMLIEEQIPAAPATEASLAGADKRARTRLERESMDKLAAQLLSEARVTVLDEATRWSWENRLR